MSFWKLRVAWHVELRKFTSHRRSALEGNAQIMTTLLIRNVFSSLHPHHGVKESRKQEKKRLQESQKLIRGIVTPAPRSQRRRRRIGSSKRGLQRTLRSVLQRRLKVRLRKLLKKQLKPFATLKKVYNCLNKARARPQRSRDQK